MKINVLEHDIEIVICSPELWSSSAMGRADIKQQQILINAGMSKDASAHTMLHEIMHLIADMASIELNENTIDFMALGMLSLIRNNPDFIKGLMK